ncbi:hypothetical protein [Brevundimonas nasdae]|uniref:hypothetical protein n=1 Tax=Brevundimonas nasdae TaxID=172043 RepID=UPI001F0B6A40|nr:hypothetical protein [Brevundimonas nasdae]
MNGMLQLRRRHQDGLQLRRGLIEGEALLMPPAIQVRENAAIDQRPVRRVRVGLVAVQAL